MERLILGATFGRDKSNGKRGLTDREKEKRGEQGQDQEASKGEELGEVSVGGQISELDTREL